MIRPILLVLALLAVSPGLARGQGAKVTAAPPVLTDGSLQGLSMTVSGGLRVQQMVGGVDVTIGGTYANASATLSTSAANVVAAVPGGAARLRIRLMNVDYATPSGGLGIVIWCRWATVAAGAAAVRGVGSFPVYPGGGIDDQGFGVNQGGLNCLAESGTPILYVETY